MLAVIFEVQPHHGKGQAYLDIAARLRPELEKIDGFIAVERFESLYHRGKYVSISYWRDEDAIRAWRTHAEHRAAQREGRQDIFADYRIRVAYVARDYGMDDREQAPQALL
jgi:heme-degrading monooxygenase HmoA